MKNIIEDDKRYFELIEEGLVGEVIDETEKRILLDLLEQLKWKLRNYRDNEFYVDVTFLDSGQVENEDGRLVWVTTNIRKEHIVSPFYNKTCRVTRIIDAVDFIEFIYEEAIEFKRMYSHYVIHGVTYNPWMSPDDKFIGEHKENTIMIHDWKCDSDEIYDIIRNRDIFYKEYYVYKGKYYKIFDVVCKEEYVKQEVDNINPETEDVTKKEVEIPCMKIYLFVNKTSETESPYKYDFNTHESTIMEERLKKDNLEKDVCYISELKKSYDMASRDKCPSAISIRMLMHLHLMTLSKDDRKTVMERCGMGKKEEENKCLMINL